MISTLKMKIYESYKLFFVNFACIVVISKTNKLGTIMKIQIRTCFIIALLLIQFQQALANPDNEVKQQSVTPFTGLGTNLIDTYSGWNSLYHVGAVGLTYFIVKNNYDAKLLRATSKMDHDLSVQIGYPGVMMGYYVPMTLPIGMYLFSDKQDDLRLASYAMMQSIGTAFALQSILKAFTGRKPPLPDEKNKEKLSRQFNFGFLKRGIHFGWPSGHLLINTAMVTTLTNFYPEKTWLKIAGAVYWSYITASVVIDERGDVHWLSEIVAGGLMGYALGKTIGTSFYKKRGKKNDDSLLSKTGISYLNCTPVVGNGYQGVGVTIGF